MFQKKLPFQPPTIKDRLKDATKRALSIEECAALRKRADKLYKAATITGGATIVSLLGVSIVGGSILGWIGLVAKWHALTAFCAAHAAVCWYVVAAFILMALITVALLLIANSTEQELENANIVFEPGHVVVPKHLIQQPAT
jgi:uncharacterized membrane protein